MSNERDSHRTAVVLFAVAAIIAILAAFGTTLERIDTRTASNEAPPPVRQASPSRARHWTVHQASRRC
jgi:hypothetical protein